MGRPSIPKEVQKGEIVSLRVQPEDNLRYTVAAYLKNKTKSEHLLDAIKAFSAEVEREDPERFKETMALYKNYRKKKKAEATKKKTTP